MTTLAYSRKENVIAVDSRTTAGSIIQSDTSEKWIESEGEIYFVVGTVSDAPIMLELIESGSILFIGESEPDVNLIKATGEPILYGIEDSVLFEVPLAACEYRAYGSGGCFALAALDMGKTAKQAVEYAMTRDIYTGGKVVQYDLTKQRFKK